jgi:hypothetical protein
MGRYLTKWIPSITLKPIGGQLKALKDVIWTTLNAWGIQRRLVSPKRFGMFVYFESIIVEEKLAQMWIVERSKNAFSTDRKQYLRTCVGKGKEWALV